MFKHGPEYVGSREQRAFDLVIANGMAPFAWMARSAIARHLAASGSDLSAVYTQTRAGRGGLDFELTKFRTLNENGQSFGPWADRFRRKGSDELAQLQNVRDGTMSVVGPRPILRRMPKTNTSENLWTIERVLDEMDPTLHNPWLQVIRKSPPGIVSSYAIHFHHDVLLPGEEANLRAVLDIEDYRNASLGRSVGLIMASAHIAMDRQVAVPMPAQ